MKALILLLLSLSVTSGEIKRITFSGINSDPLVLYTEEFTPDTLKFEVIESRPVYASKTGKQRLGALKTGTICELIGFDHRAFKIKGTAKHGGVAGWVSPHALSCNDPDFIENFKKLYEREMLVRELISNKEIAIGMTPEEVHRVMGEPTKKSMRRTANGTSGTYEYLTMEEKKHYDTFVDPATDQLYRTYSHTTQEIKERVAIEFENGAASAIEKEEDHSIKNRGPRIIGGPIYLDWQRYIIRR